MNIMKNKVLMVTSIHEFSGGAICSKRNYRALCNIFGNENVEIFDLSNINKHNTNILIKLFNFINGKLFSIFVENIIIEKSKYFTIVFLDSSIYGQFAKKIKIKHPYINIISFFHNMELDYYKDCVPKINLLWKVYCNEKFSCIYSDITIALNYRDVKRIKQIYGKKVDAIIPISFTDRHINFNQNNISNILTGLFFGSNFIANIQGIHWFIRNVLPYIDIKLQIIIKDINKENLPQNNKLELIGFVENLEPYIQNADLIILPIFLGSGMKVKTCEALMYGKNIIGTEESFIGYDVDFDKIGAKCENAQEFIKAINEFPKRFKSKYNEYSRKIFLEKYNDIVVYKQFNDLIFNYY